MDMSLENTEYCSLKKTYEGTVEESVEAEISLPEYMPEILRIIKSSAVPKINSFTTVGERVTVDGTCELRMIYVGSDNCIYTFSQTRNFTRYIENSAFTSAEDIRVKATLNYVNCRATNTKRAEIKAGVVICVCAFGKVTENVLSTVGSSVVQEKRTELSVMSLGCKKSRMFAMSDNITLENESAAFLVRANATAVLGETRKISNKIMLKGETVVEIAYVPNEDKSVIHTVRKSLPINQILEFEGMEEHFTGDITLEVTAVDVIIKNDSQGEGKSLQVAIAVNAGITMWEQKELAIITDAYAVNGVIDLSYKKIKLFSALDAIRDTHIFKDSVDTSKIGVGSILDAFCEECESTLSFNEGVLSVSGTLKITMLLKDMLGSIVTLEKMLDFCYERKAEMTDKKVDCTPDVAVTSLECELKSKEQIDIRAELQINCSVLGEALLDVVAEIAEGTSENAKTRSAITVYFPKHEEELWNIAKRYNTTVESIALENNIEGSTTGEMKMLFIPSA